MPADVQKQVLQYYEAIQRGVPAPEAFRQAFPNGIPTQQDQMKDAAKAQQEAGYGQIGGMLAGALGTKAAVDYIGGSGWFAPEVASGVGAATGAGTGAGTAALAAPTGLTGSWATPMASMGAAPVGAGAGTAGASGAVGTGAGSWATGLSPLAGAGLVIGGTMLSAELGKQLMKQMAALEPQSHFKRGYDAGIDLPQISAQIKQAFPDATDDQIAQIVSKAREGGMITTPSVNKDTGQTYAGTLAQRDPFFGYGDESNGIGGNALMKGYIRGAHFEQTPDNNPYAMSMDDIRKTFGDIMGGSPYAAGPVQFNPGGQQMPPPQGPRVPGPEQAQGPGPTPMQIMQGQSNMSPQMLEAQLKQNAKFGDQLLNALRGMYG